MLNEPNSLVNEVSPYLLQHSYNPVKWYAWNDGTLEKAKVENKLLLISIGYSSCHWCHVMEKESFMDSDIADIMNQKYICIKVDREERPDIDQVYMNAVQIITRRGGWPLNCFALPNGKPVYGGTYFPKEQWRTVLESMSETWTNEPQKVIDVANELQQGIVNSEVIVNKSSIDSNRYKTSLDLSISSILSKLDRANGGTVGAPKFPMPGLIKLFVEYANHSKDTASADFANITLQKIANGGIYDHVGGGFFRYAVDEKWAIPHFEKMLYDNAQLIELYSFAYRLSQNPTYSQIVENSVNFLVRELQTPNGGFYSALDADCNGIEGQYYTWNKYDLESILGYDTELFCSAYGVSITGNWSPTNVLHRCISDEQLESIFDIPTQEIEYRLKRSIEKLFIVRGSRIPPLIDDKVITSWNGLTISALAHAYISFNNKYYLELALRAAENLEQNHFSDGELFRVQCKGKLYTEPFLDDYANYINSLITLYTATLDSKWIEKANLLLTKSIDKFWDANSGMFYYTSHNNKLIARKMELIDSVMPSANAVMAGNLFRLADLTNNIEYKQMANQMLANISDNITGNGLFVYAWVSLFLSQSLPQVRISYGRDSMADARTIQSRVVYPNICFDLLENSTNGISICIGSSCQKTSEDIEEIIRFINGVNIE